MTVSPDINIRGTQLYSVIGRIDETILFFHDKASTKKVILYNDQLQYKSEREISLENDRANVVEVVLLDTVFGVIYNFRDKEVQTYSFATFNNKAEAVFNDTIISTQRDWRSMSHKPILSEDRKLLCLYSILNSDQIRIIVYDMVKCRLLSRTDVLIKQTNLQDDVRDIKLTNRGEVVILAEINNSRSQRERHLVNVFTIDARSGGTYHEQFSLKNYVCANLVMSVNNHEGTIGIAGLCDEKRDQESSYYMWMSGKPGDMAQSPVIMKPLDRQLMFEIYGDKKKSRLQSFLVNDIIWQENGEAIMVLEMQVDMNRRINSGGTIVQNRYRPFGNLSEFSGWSDHYREDIVLLALDKSGKLRWHQVFYKKQFSQNDNGVYSSYFKMRTPSRIRIVYNDEIKANSTVSEYIFNSLGDYRRSSVFNTEYQGLKLRFTEAIQLSSSEILVPSQSAYALNLVKIEY